LLPVACLFVRLTFLFVSYSILSSELLVGLPELRTERFPEPRVFGLPCHPVRRQPLRTATTAAVIACRVREAHFLLKLCLVECPEGRLSTFGLELLDFFVDVLHVPLVLRYQVGCCCLHLLVQQKLCLVGRTVLTLLEVLL
jgi:hypothetical protein